MANVDYASKEPGPQERALIDYQRQQQAMQHQQALAADGRVSAAAAQQAASGVATLMNEALDRRDANLCKAQLAEKVKQEQWPEGVLLPDAMTRDAAISLAREAVARALKRDREHRPEDGWV